MGLAVDYCDVLDGDDRLEGESWVVYMEQFPDEQSVVASGFGRRIDAEIAAHVLPQTGIDFDVTDYDDFRRQRIAYGGYEAIEKFAIEHLQW